MSVANDVKGFLAQYPVEVRDLALRVRAFVLEAVPAAKEKIDSSAKIIGYGFGPGYKDLICTIIPSKSGVKLGIARGAYLPDPASIMKGSGKVHRHVPIDALADLKNPAIKLLLKAAFAAWKRETKAGG